MLDHLGTLVDLRDARRMVLISLIGLAPAATDLRTQWMAKCLALIFRRSIESRYSMKSLAALRCWCP